MANKPDAVTLAQMQVDVLQRLNDDNIVTIATNGAASGTQEGLLHGAGLGVENGKINARVIRIDGNHGCCLPKPSRTLGSATAS